MSFEPGRHVPIRGFHLKDYFYKEICLTVDPILGPTHPLKDLNQTNCSSLVEYLRIHHFENAHGRLKDTSWSALDPNEVTLRKALQKSDGRRALKNQLKMLIVGGRHRHQVILTLCREYDPQ